MVSPLAASLIAAAVGASLLGLGVWCFQRLIDRLDEATLDRYPPTAMKALLEVMRLRFGWRIDAIKGCSLLGATLLLASPAVGFVAHMGLASS